MFKCKRITFEPKPLVRAFFSKPYKTHRVPTSPRTRPQSLANIHQSGSKNLRLISTSTLQKAKLTIRPPHRSPPSPCAPQATSPAECCAGPWPPEPAPRCGQCLKPRSGTYPLWVFLCQTLEGKSLPWQRRK